MALEPIGSMMTLQAQTLNNQQTAPQKTAMEYTDVSISENTPKVDDTTKVVENVDEKSNSNDEHSYDAPTNESLHQAVTELRKKMTNSEAVFGIHEGTNRVTIKIVDKQTKEVIKELPPEKTLDMIARVWEMAGILVDERR